MRSSHWHILRGRSDGVEADHWRLRPSAELLDLKVCDSCRWLGCIPRLGVPLSCRPRSRSVGGRESRTGEEKTATIPRWRRGVP